MIEWQKQSLKCEELNVYSHTVYSFFFFLAFIFSFVVKWTECIVSCSTVTFYICEFWFQTFYFSMWALPYTLLSRSSRRCNILQICRSCKSSLKCSGRSPLTYSNVIDLVTDAHFSSISLHCIMRQTSSHSRPRFFPIYSHIILKTPCLIFYEAGIPLGIE